MLALVGERLAKLSEPAAHLEHPKASSENLAAEANPNAVHRLLGAAESYLRMVRRLTEVL